MTTELLKPALERVPGMALVAALALVLTYQHAENTEALTSQFSAAIDAQRQQIATLQRQLHFVSASTITHLCEPSEVVCRQRALEILEEFAKSHTCDD